MKERTVIINAMSTVITYSAFENGEVTSLELYTDKVFKDSEQALSYTRKVVESKELRVLDIVSIGRIKTKYELPFSVVLSQGTIVSKETVTE